MGISLEAKLSKKHMNKRDRKKDELVVRKKYIYAQNSSVCSCSTLLPGIMDDPHPFFVLISDVINFFVN